MNRAEKIFAECAAAIEAAKKTVDIGIADWAIVEMSKAEQTQLYRKLTAAFKAKGFIWTERFDQNARVFKFHAWLSEEMTVTE